MKKLFVLSILTFVMAACAAKKATVSITDAHAQKAAAKYPGASMATLQQGKTLYEDKCGKCHGLKDPGAYDEAQWGKHVKRMAPKAKIDKPTEDLILQYVVTLSGK